MTAFWLGSGSTGTFSVVVQMKSAVCPDLPSLICLLAGSRAKADASAAKAWTEGGGLLEARMSREGRR
jgi:hypothetical protein